MFLEWLLIILLLGGCVLLFAARAGRALGVGLALFAAAALYGALIWQRKVEARLKARAELSTPTMGRPDEFAGSDSCRSCHPAQYTSWHQTYHRTMTQVASPESVRGNFNNVTLTLDGEEYRLESRGDEFWVEMPDPNPRLSGELAINSAIGSLSSNDGMSGQAGRIHRRITMVTGSHHMQAYWVGNEHGNQQFSFPFTYLFEQERWVPRRAVMLIDPRRTDWMQVWNVGCIGCHSTGGQPRAQPNRIDFDSRVAELGIACEACHGPAARHVALNSDPIRRYGMHLRDKTDDTIVNPARLSKKHSSEVCGRCHSVSTPRFEKDWLKEGDEFRPGEDLERKLRVLLEPRSRALREGSFWSDGMIRVSGREYNGLIRTPCFQRGEMSCLSCHSMHDSPPANQLTRGMETNDACLQCHTSMTGKVEEHTRHPAGSSGSLCYNCHMPYTTYGLLKALRSHEVSTPSVRSTLETGRPNACNLCHLDKTLDWTSQTLSAWYKQPVETVPEKHNTVAASVIWTVQGDAGQRALMAWHMGWEPARETSGEQWLPPYLTILMQDPYPAVRYIAGRSLKRLHGFQETAYDYIDEDALGSVTEAVLANWIKHPPPANPAVLLDMRGINQAAVRELLKDRDHRVVELNE